MTQTIEQLSFSEKFCQSKFKNGIDRQEAISKDWEQLTARVRELEEENARLRREDFSHERIQNDSLKLQNKVLYEQLISAQAEIKRLEERRCEICGYAEHHREHTGCLRTQLAAEQLNNKRLRDALEFFFPDWKTYDHLSWKYKAKEALSTPISTEALDAYVAEKVKEAIK